MKVKAIKLGYYELSKRPEGTVFELNDPKDFSKKWMVQVGGASPQGNKKETKQKQVKEESIAETEVI